MILEKFNILPNTAWSSMSRNANDLAQFTSMYILVGNFTFPSIDDFLDLDYFIQAIKDEDIYPIQNIKGVTKEDAQTLYNRGEDQISFKVKNGEYIYRISNHLDFDYSKLITKFSEKDITVVFADKNNNLYATSPLGTYIQGLSVNIINVEPIDIGDEKLKYQPIYIELSESEELTDYGVVVKPDFKVNKVNIIFLDITIISQSISQLEFSVIDTVLSCPINGLESSDILISDSINGVITGTVSNKGDGLYTLTNPSADIYFGTIAVDTNKYFGNVAYLVSNPIVNVDIFDVTVPNDSQINFSVRETISTNAVTDLLESALTILDDIAGYLTIDVFTNLGGGDYTVTTTTANVDEGVLTISDINYLGSGAFAISGVYDLIVSLSTEYYSQISVNVTYLTTPVIGLITSNFNINDTFNAVSIDNVIDNGSGDYTLYLSGIRSEGSITVTNGGYSAFETYEYTNREIRNSGATGTTDWVDTDGNGTADYFIPTCDTSIVDYGGTIGRVQRIDHNGEGWLGNQLLASTFGLKNNTDYQLKLKYKSNNLRIIIENEIGTTISDEIVQYDIAFVTYTSATFPSGTNEKFNIYFRLPSYPDYAELNEVELIEE